MTGCPKKNDPQEGYKESTGVRGVIKGRGLKLKPQQQQQQQQQQEEEESEKSDF